MIVVEVRGQANRTNDQVNNQKNPTWQKRMKFFVSSPLEVIKIKLFDYSPSLSTMLFAFDVMAADLPLVYAEKSNQWKVSLSHFNPAIRGNLIFDFTYTPILHHPYYKVSRADDDKLSPPSPTPRRWSNTVRI